MERVPKKRPRYAADSPKIQKKRKTTEKGLKAMDAKITKAALDKVKKRMKVWAERHKGERQPLEGSRVKVMTESDNPKTLAIRKMIKTELEGIANIEKLGG